MTTAEQRQRAVADFVAGLMGWFAALVPDEGQPALALLGQWGIVQSDQEAVFLGGWDPTLR